MGDYTEHEHTNEVVDGIDEVDAATVNDGFAGDYADSLDEYEGPTAAEAAEVFEQARRQGFVLPDLSSLDLRKLDWAAIRRGDFSSFGQLELPKLDIRNLDVADLDPRRIDFDKVKHEASEFAATAVAKAGEVATDVRRNVESGVKLAREVVGL